MRPANGRVAAPAGSYALDSDAAAPAARGSDDRPAVAPAAPAKAPARKDRRGAVDDEDDFIFMGA